MCLGNVSKDFTIDNMKQTGSKRGVNFFSVDCRSIDSNKILDIYEYLIKKLL